MTLYKFSPSKSSIQCNHPNAADAGSSRRFQSKNRPHPIVRSPHAHARAMRSNARVAIAIAVTLACVAPSTASEARARADIVRGAHPSKIHLYDVDVFSCDDGRTRVPRARINDEYCDCGDGSDEPGTSACAGRTGAPGFYCPNVGSTPKTVASSRVDDGVCDCCDGSDERGTSSMNKKTCPNACFNEAKARREELVAELSRARRGTKARDAAAAKTRGRREAWVKEREALEKEAAKKKEVVDAMRVELDAVEEIERKAREAREAAEAKAREEEEAARASEEGERGDAEGGDTTTEEGRIVEGDESAPHDDETGAEKPADDAEETDEERGKRIASQWISDEGAEEPGPEEPEPQEFDDRVDDVDDSTFSFKSRIGGLLDRAKSFVARRADDKLTDSVNSKKDAHRRQKEALDDMESKIQELKTNIERDYGPEDAMISLLGRCFDAKIEKYKYSACPFGDATQDHVRLGSHDSVETNDDGHVTLTFNAGDSCWSGPSRSLALSLRCGEKDELVSIDEPSRCEYVGVARTPIACDPTTIDTLERELRELERLIATASSSGAKTEL